ncbi:MAG: adenylate/guanylate cyclase domain-containing protein [Candidatus Cloacimonas sp.]|nr:adenylate/guanylate cyclase domain-containing protein [Candidatus Cloacimonadota bacterium]
MKKNLYYFFIPLTLFIVALIFFYTHFWDFLEHKMYDTLFMIRGPKSISNEIVIVTIDDDTFSSLDMRWPFPREIYAKMIKNLYRAGARQVVFDIEFTESSYLEDDQALVNAAKEFGNVVFAGKLIRESRTNADLVQLIKPIPLIREAGFDWGFVNINPDKDGFIRKYSLSEDYGKEKYHPIGIISLANLQNYLIEQEQKIRIEKDYIHLPQNRRIPRYLKNHSFIQYYGEPQTFKYYSLSSVIDDSDFILPGIETEDFQINEFYDLLDNEVFKDKIVLVGASVAELHDTFNTPFSTKSLMPGVEIHANFMEMVLQNDFLKPISIPLMLTIILLLAFICYWLFSNLKPVFSLILAILLVISHLALSYFLFAHKNIVITVLQIPFILILSYLTGLIYHYIKANREKKQIKKTFMHYMAPDLVHEVLKNPKMLKFGGTQQEVTVLFSDIRGFTTYSEKHTPQETVAILKEYLTAMVDVIIENRGILDKFVGDEIMALFGTPVKLDNSALSACKTALDMRHALTNLQIKWQEEGRDVFEIGIGINTGPAVVGNLGSEQIFDYTAIGDTINLGARLEAINKDYDTKHKIIISEFTLAKVEGLVETKFLDEVKVKGKNEAVKIYELIDIIRPETMS